MPFKPIMWIVWGALFVIMAALFLYRSRLTKNEEDQLFLDDSFAHERNEQAAIIAKANRIEPVLRISEWMVLAMSVVVVLYYIRDILVHLDFIH
jgi:hypothetical protein